MVVVVVVVVEVVVVVVNDELEIINHNLPPVQF